MIVVFQLNDMLLNFLSENAIYIVSANDYYTSVDEPFLSRLTLCLNVLDTLRIIRLDTDDHVLVLRDY